jgi:shikimate kinase
MTVLNNTIIYLIGIPAVGKYTTAKAIAHRTGAKVVDNHLINNPIFSLSRYSGTDASPFPRDGWKYIGRIRQAVLSFIRDVADPQDSFIFTNVIGASEGGGFRQVERVARKRKAAFVPVWLKCDPSELRKRKDTPDRRERLKEIDLGNIDWWLTEYKELPVQHPNALVLDTTRRSPAQNAQLILQHVSRCKAGSGLRRGK